MELGNYDDANFDYQSAKDLDPNDNDIVLKIKEAKAQQKKNKKDYYKILGLEKTASADDIRKAYRKMAVKWHPNRNNSGTEEEKKQAEKQFKLINEANTILTDPQKKQIYDNGGDPDDPNGKYLF
jgi:DnaJ family protein C protein 7